MMIMITKPRGKLKKVATAGAMVLLLGVAVPLGYSALSDADAMSLFAAGEKISDKIITEEVDTQSVAEPPTENVEENAEETEGATGLWQGVKQVIFGEEAQIIRY